MKEKSGYSGVTKTSLFEDVYWIVKAMKDSNIIGGLGLFKVLNAVDSYKDTPKVYIDLLLDAIQHFIKNLFSQGYPTNKGRLCILNEITLNTDELPDNYRKVITYIKDTRQINARLNLPQLKLGLFIGESLLGAFVKSESIGDFLGIDLGGLTEVLYDSGVFSALDNRSEIINILKLLLPTIEHELVHYIQYNLLTYLNPKKVNNKNIDWETSDHEAMWKEYISFPYEQDAWEISTAYTFVNGLSDNLQAFEVRENFLKFIDEDEFIKQIKASKDSIKYRKVIRNIWSKITSLIG